MTDLGKLLEFIKLTHELRNVRRTIHFERDDIQENDMEHGYQLALAAWFLIDNDKLPLDKSRCIALALTHDVVEAYTGDISATLPESEHPSRKKNEKLAAEKLKKKWPSMPEMYELIMEYQNQSSPEAVFVYALDKLLPVLNIYLYDGRTWKILDMSLDDLKRIKVGKIDISPEIYDYYKEFLKIAEKHPKLFAKNGRIQ